VLLKVFQWVWPNASEAISVWHCCNAPTVLVNTRVNGSAVWICRVKETEC
jgi:hypothetical protein